MLIPRITPRDWASLPETQVESLFVQGFSGNLGLRTVVVRERLVINRFVKGERVFYNITQIH